MELNLFVPPSFVRPKDAVIVRTVAMGVELALSSSIGAKQKVFRLGLLIKSKG